MNNDILVSMKKDILIQIRVTQELKNALDEVAKREGMTANRLLIYNLAEKYPELVPLILKH